MQRGHSCSDMTPKSYMRWEGPHFQNELRSNGLGAQKPFADPYYFGL